MATHLGAAVHEVVARLGVELRGGDYFSELLHVCWLDINNVCRGWANTAAELGLVQSAISLTVADSGGVLKLWSDVSRFHRLILRSSAEM